MIYLGISTVVTEGAIAARERSEFEVFAEATAKKYGFQRQYLIRILQEIQSRFGYLPKESLITVANVMGIPLTEVLTVATFYHQFRLERPGKYLILVCMGTACHLRGNTQNYKFLRTYLGIRTGESTTPDGLFTVEKARCFGCCSLAPVIMVMSRDGKHKKLYGGVDPVTLRRIINQYRAMERSKSK